MLWLTFATKFWRLLIDSIGEDAVRNRCSKEDLARIQNKIHLVCLPSEDEMGRQLWIVDEGRLPAWNDDYKPVEQAAEPIRNFLERQQAAMDDIIKYYEENKGNLADMRTMAGQIRFGKNANQSSCNLIIHSKDLSDRAITKQLAEMVLSVSFTRFVPEKNSRVKIVSENTATGHLLTQVVEILLENGVDIDILHVKVKSDVAVMMGKHLGTRNFTPFTPLCAGMLDDYKALAKTF
ncbi:unnamed protein product, partial [Mesorhabditis spiculigera]